jgi:hypothetical protein
MKTNLTMLVLSLNHNLLNKNFVFSTAISCTEIHKLNKRPVINGWSEVKSSCG